MEASAFLNKRSPLKHFETWLEEAKKTNLKHPDAFVLSTVDSSGHPASRVLLLKEIRNSSLIFFTNYDSQKSQHMLKNPSVSLNFFWDSLWKQVCFRGTIKKIPKVESEQYWETRPRDSQLGAWTSKQSQPVKDRLTMEEELKAQREKFHNKIIPLPENWGGFEFMPTYVEFWIGREGRFHDRYAYQKVENEWRGQRLYP